MYEKLLDTIAIIQDFTVISAERKIILQPLIDYIQLNIHVNQATNLNFICTHNSRRSHLAQIWGQCAAYYYIIPSVYCYSGGTEETSLFPMVVKTIQNQGFMVSALTKDDNTVYAIKMDKNTMPIISFSKKYNHSFNPAGNFAAIMTCSEADNGCPFIAGAEIRLPVQYEDPKISDYTSLQDKVYSDRSLEIAKEMFYVFSKIDIQKS
ncbi:low molecular weight phosphatase family protein [Sphingobacterium bovistauri]|uniref:Protein-tyrosine-phosphatase n=1 Tax=Sphingobacterium bovistauri TaxID=2781959 RepID=A0ABS7ZAG8_9SPHI|nr:protein-tyrosine-phosphatase [Sphingobacterium bovistauri]MCA5006401.1 protein-tyrosine-phosphatase [Sphingobacterium bovistauri]